MICSSNDRRTAALLAALVACALAACPTGAGNEPDAAGAAADAGASSDAAPPSSDGALAGDGAPFADAAPPADAALPDASGPAEACSNQLDDDGDGQIDCADADCGFAFACTAPACPVGQTRLYLEVPELPRFFSTTPFGADFAVTQAGIVGKVAAGFSLLHMQADDVQVTVVAPGGQRIVVAQGHASPSGYLGTVVDDDASVALGSGTAPYTGTFLPDQPLGVLEGQAAAGTWRLEVADAVLDGMPALDTGAVRDLGLVVCVCTDCELGPIACADSIDNDGDGQTDCADVDCQGLLACLLSCAPGSLAISVVGGGLPVAIPDGDTAGVLVRATVLEQGLVEKTIVRFSTDLTWDGDLDLYLAPPDGAPYLDLTSDNGGSGDFYTETVFSDAAGTSITAGSPPFTGVYRPEQPLAGLNGESAAGGWTLNAVDDEAIATGSVTDFQLTLCLNPNVELGLDRCTDQADNDGDLLVDCADDDCPCSQLACPAGQTLVSAGAADLPVPFTFVLFNTTPTTCTATVAQAGVVRKVMVGFSLDHGAVWNLQTTLVSPTGTEVALSNAFESGDMGFKSTVLHDAAFLPLLFGTPPYTGEYKPTEAFSAFDGEPAMGDWLLGALDSFASGGGAEDNGVITDYHLWLCVE